MNRRMTALIAGAGVLITLAVPALARSAKKDLTVAFLEKRIQDLSASGLLLNFVFKVTNSSSAPWYATGYDYRVVIENTEYFAVRSALPQPIAVAPSGDTFIALPVKITNANLFKAVPSAEGKDKVACYLIGGVNFAENPRAEGDRLAVACSGEFPVFRDIELAFQPLEVRSLTIGGGDLTFQASLTNRNDFALRIVSLRYALELAGVKVSEGEIRTIDGLEAKATKDLSVPLLLDFFEIGNALYAPLQRSVVAGKFSGTADIDTEWGRFTVPVERTADIAVGTGR
jgi:LEA14-like dessication related protein